MTTGTNDKKKVYFLAALGVFAAYMVYSNLLSGPPAPEATSAPRPAATPPPSIAMPERTSSGKSAAPVRAGASRGRTEEFHPVVRSKRLEERINPIDIDPTLRLDLFARVQAVNLTGGSRNLFQFSTPPVKDVPKLAGAEPVVAFRKVGPEPPPPPAPPPPTPPPAPITIKFYGYSTTLLNAKKTGLFLDGDEILLGAEGDTLKRRYKVLRIMPTSVLIEDMDAKRQQSVPITEEAQS